MNKEESLSAKQILSRNVELLQLEIDKLAKLKKKVVKRVKREKPVTNGCPGSSSIGFIAQARARNHPERHIVLWTCPHVLLGKRIKENHHLDYTKEYEVEYVCAACHRKRDHGWSREEIERDWKEAQSEIANNQGRGCDLGKDSTIRRKRRNQIDSGVRNESVGRENGKGRSGVYERERTASGRLAWRKKNVAV